MRIVLVTLCNLFLFSSCQSDSEYVDVTAECQFCILEEHVQDAEIKYVVSKVKNKPYQDSLKAVLDSLYVVKNEKLDSFSRAYKLDDFSTEDSIRSWCYDNRPYGEGISLEKSRRMMWWLGNEIILYNSGQVLSNGEYIQGDEYVEDFINKENGDTVTIIDGEKVKIENFPKWREQQLAEWEEWMIKVNLYFEELTGKSFSEMSESDVFFLKFKLKMFMDGKKSYP
ncbi:hypothetical protein K6119_08030 [Paracrocinitomix mangrovi]|uniref:hypothetical protein n=1 Tax=Paracrocinitomix mangrovi TaxID=2862509 RepID=UPI001C8F0781|nr:hypothetical protein [Paracrocinitomix mangrovi]UKN03460.1 hypothetical protein K6119_08030 [Paracrocinitomix mangrovi]